MSTTTDRQAENSKDNHVEDDLFAFLQRKPHVASVIFPLKEWDHVCAEVPPPSQRAYPVELLGECRGEHRAEGAEEGDTRSVAVDKTLAKRGVAKNKIVERARVG